MYNTVGTFAIEDMAAGGDGGNDFSRRNGRFYIHFKFNAQGVPEDGYSYWGVGGPLGRTGERLDQEGS